MFVVSKPAKYFTSLSDNSLRDYILISELDVIYSNQATPNYIKHITQDWDNEPFIKAGYMTDNADSNTVKNLANLWPIKYILRVVLMQMVKIGFLIIQLHNQQKPQLKSLANNTFIFSF